MTLSVLPLSRKPKLPKTDLEKSDVSENITAFKPPSNWVKPSNGQHRLKNREPFDPEDLSRRLNAYLVEQKIASKRRKKRATAKERERAAAQGIPDHAPIPASTNPKSNSNAKTEPYHHVPVVAAAAFERTATPRPAHIDTAHKLSAPVIRAALSPTGGANAAAPAHRAPSRSTSTKQSSATTLQQTVAHDYVEAEKERVRNRNQFQLTQALEDAAEMDDLSDVNRMPRRVFAEFAHLRNAHHGSPPVSSDTENLLAPQSPQSSADITNGKKMDPMRAQTAFGRRYEWTQTETRRAHNPGPNKHESSKNQPSEGTLPSAATRRMSTGTPWLRKRESILVILGRKDKTKSDLVPPHDNDEENAATLRTRSAQSAPAISTAAAGAAAVKDVVASPSERKRGLWGKFRRSTEGS